MKAGGPESPSGPNLEHRRATLDDADLLARLNAVLIRDEGSRNPMGPAELRARMHGWLEGEGYVAVIFALRGAVAAYAVYRKLNAAEIYIRQLLVLLEHRRQGVGRECLRLLAAHYWPPGARVTVEVLAGNAPALAFWRGAGFADYSVALKRPA